jgi:hypothetical protein
MRVTSKEWSGNSFSTSSTRRLTSEVWAVSPPLLTPVVLLLKSGQFFLNQ